MLELPPSRPLGNRDAYGPSKALSFVATRLGSTAKLGALSRMLNTLDDDADGTGLAQFGQLCLRCYGSWRPMSTRRCWLCATSPLGFAVL